MYRGSIRLEPPFLFALSFIFLFTIGGLTGLMIGALSPNVHLHNTYFIVGHFHYVIFGGMGFGMFGAFHYWLPKITGKMYGKMTAVISWLVMFTGFNIFYFTMFILGWEGMPRRYYDYPPQYAELHTIASIGAFIMVAGFIVMAYNLLHSVFRGSPAPSNPWEGATLEWSLPSPPETEDFREIPVITRGPYDYSIFREKK
jgi:cytochrome c oxidase subunit 1